MFENQLESCLQSVKMVPFRVISLLLVIAPKAFSDDRISFPGSTSDDRGSIVNQGNSNTNPRVSGDSDSEFSLTKDVKNPSRDILENISEQC